MQAMPDAAAMQRELELLGETADAAIPRLAEVSIGHGLTADAMEYGMAMTVQRFLQACSSLNYS